MNEEKWKVKVTEDIEILDDDFLDDQTIKIQKKYPNNTQDSEIEILDDFLEEETVVQPIAENSQIQIKEIQPKKDEIEANIELNSSKNNNDIETNIEFLKAEDLPNCDKINAIDQNNKIQQKANDLKDNLDFSKLEIISNDKPVEKSDIPVKENTQTMVPTIDQPTIETTIEKQTEAVIPIEEISEKQSKEVVEQLPTLDPSNIEFLNKQFANLENSLTNITVGEDTTEILEIEKKEDIQTSNKPKKKIWILSLLTCLALISFFAYKAFFWQKDSYATNKQIQAIVKTTKTKESLIKKENIIGATTPEDDRYFNYLDVDFTNLISKNNDVKGWIKVNNTNINYPFVQSEDNDYYLRHSFDKSYNTAGWVFADFRNNFEEFDQNTVLYAHGRLDNTMFGSLKKIVEKNWYENMENEFVQISTPKSNSIWQVFSVYTIEPELYYITPNFDKKEDYKVFLETLNKRSVHDFKVELNEEDKILTLSSCYNDLLRVVLHAKLVNIEQK